MREAYWVSDNGGESKGSSHHSAWKDSNPIPGFERTRSSACPGTPESEKAMFSVRSADFEQNIDYLRRLTHEAGFSDKNRERMLEAINKLQEAKREMGSIIEDECSCEKT